MTFDLYIPMIKYQSISGCSINIQEGNKFKFKLSNMKRILRLYNSAFALKP